MDSGEDGDYSRSGKIAQGRPIPDTGTHPQYQGPSLFSVDSTR